MEKRRVHPRRHLTEVEARGTMTQNILRWSPSAHTAGLFVAAHGADFPSDDDSSALLSHPATLESTTWARQTPSCQESLRSGCARVRVPSCILLSTQCPSGADQCNA